jgi:pectin-derived oligosaccharide transport system substrate-binding protein
MLTRREFTAAGLGLVATPSLLALLEACGGSSSAPSSTQTQVGPEASGGKLELAWWGGSDRAKRTQQVMDLFTKKYPKYTFDSSFTAFNAYWDKINTQAAGGALPDIIQMDMRYLGQFTQRNQLLDLTKFADAELNMGDFDKGQREQASVNGKLYAVSLGGNTQSVVYNATAISQAGMQPPTGKESWDQFAAYCKQLQAKLPAGMAALDDGSWDITPFEVFVRQRTKKELYTQDGRAVFTKADAEAWLNMWSDYRSAGFIVPGPVAAAENQQDTPDNATVVQGKAAMRLQWSNFVGQYQTLMKNATIGITAHPGGAGTGTYIKVSQAFSLSAKTQFPHAGAAFIGFFITNPDAVGVLGLERGVPASAKSRSLLAPNMSPADKIQLDFINAQVKNNRAKTVLDPSGAGEVQKAIARNALSIPLSKVSVSAAADKFISEANKALTA